MQIGICLSKVIPSQLYYELVKGVNDGIKDRTLQDDVTIFYEDKATVFPNPMCSQMHISEIWGFKGVLVATSISTAAKLLKAPSATHRYLYMYNLEWLNQKLFPYEPLVATIGQFRIITRTEEHSKLWHNNFNQVPFGTLKYMNVTQLSEILHASQTRDY